MSKTWRLGWLPCLSLCEKGEERLDQQANKQSRSIRKRGPLRSSPNNCVRVKVPGTKGERKGRGRQFKERRPVQSGETVRKEAKSQGDWISCFAVRSEEGTGKQENEKKIKK